MKKLCVISLLSFLLASACYADGDWIGLKRRLLPSPDGEHMLALTERDRYGERSFTLTMFMSEKDGFFFGVQTLTPIIRWIGAAPEGNLFLVLIEDYERWQGIYTFDPETEALVNIANAFTDASIEEIRLSADGQFVAYSTVSSDGYRAQNAVKVTGGWAIDPPTEAPRFIQRTEWVQLQPPEPEQLPFFLKQEMPRLTESSPIAWGPDGQTVYVGDASGLWRCDIGEYLKHRWTRIVDADRLRRFDLSPTGSHLVYELEGERKGDPPFENGIWVVRTDGMNPRRLGSGWDATFAPKDGSRVFYANRRWLVSIKVDGTDRKELFPVGRNR